MSCQSGATTQLFIIVGWIIAGILSMMSFYRRLRTRHPQVWRELGEPALYDGTSDKSRVARFLWLGEHRLLRDPRLDRLAACIRVLGAICGGSAAAAMLYVPISRLIGSVDPVSAYRTLLAIFLVLALPGLLMGHRLVRRLRDHHHDEWARLGSPVRPWFGGPTTTLRTIGFFWSMRFLSLNDRLVTRTSFSLLLVSISLLVVLILLIGRR